MQNIIYCSSLYSDIGSLYSLVASMEYKDCIFGAEIKDFSFIPKGIEQTFEGICNCPLEIQPNTGIFRKPYASIHCEQFYQHCLWNCVVALEDTKMTLWEQEDVKSFFDVKSEDLEQFILTNSSDHSKWVINNQLNMKKNDFIFIRPWTWYSMEKDKLIQVFLLNQRAQES